MQHLARRFRVLVAVALAVTLQMMFVEAASPAAAPAKPPAVTKLSKSSGPTAGATKVKVTGKNFTGVRSVTFGGVSGTKLKVISPKKLRVTAPKHAAGTVDIIVRTNAGSSRSVPAARFTYVAPPVITGLDVTSGSPDGGTRVGVVGANFVKVQKVLFGSASGKNLSVGSPTSLHVTTPAAAAGGVSVRVVTRYGTSQPVDFATFSYTDWVRADLPTPSGATPQSFSVKLACWEEDRCAGAGTYSSAPGVRHAVLWRLSGRNWTAEEAPLPADAADEADPRPVAISCGDDGLCVAWGDYEVHVNGADRI